MRWQKINNADINSIQTTNVISAMAVKAKGGHPEDQGLHPWAILTRLSPHAYAIPI